MHNISSGGQKRGICIVLVVVGKKRQRHNISSGRQKRGIGIILRVECKRGAYALYWQW